MQQRQLRLGDVLDDYCPRERRVTNHAIVAMIGPDVKQTRCTTCDTEHEYKHAKVPRQRKKSDTPAALYAQVLANGPKRVVHEPPPATNEPEIADESPSPMAVAAPAEPMREDPIAAQPAPEDSVAAENDADSDRSGDPEERVDNAAEDGPVHRPLIRATLPRQEGAPPPPRPAPEFTIRQPGGRPNRFRHRPGRGPQQFQSNRSNGGGTMGGPHRGGGGMPRHGGGRQPQGAMSSRPARRNGPGRKR
jgi:hypothetical protein